MTEATDNDYRSCVHSVLALYGDLSGKFEVESEVELKFRCCFPLAMYALNQLYVATKIADLNREFLATANVRVAFEHAVTAQWVMYVEGAEERMVGTMKRHNRLIVRAISAHAKVPADLLSGFGRDGDPTMPNFEQRCMALEGDAGALFFLYRALSEAIHPSTATLAQHLVFDDQGNAQGIKFGALNPPPTDMWMTAAISAMACAFTIEAFRKNQPRLPLVRELSERFKVPTSLKATS